MNSKFKRNRSAHQANLKLDGQKLFKIDDDGGFLSNFGGLPLASKIIESTGLIQMAVERISEWRDPDRINFSISELLTQRAFLAACGLPNANDCSFWKNDPALKSAVLKEPDSPPFASQSTHTRMENRLSKETIQSLESLPLDFFFAQQKHAPRHLTIYIDGTAIRTFGAQQNSTYRGGKKYSQTQYFPLIVTTDKGDLLLAQLRSGADSDARSVAAISKLLLDIKGKWKNIQLTVVMDTGFNSPALLDILEAAKILYVIGYPATSSVKINIKDICRSVEKDFQKRFGKPKYIGTAGTKLWQKEHQRIRALPAKQRMATEKEHNQRHVRWTYQCLHNGVNWHSDRPVIHRVDFTDKGLDIRCVVTNIKNGLPDSIYKEEYCRRARIEMFIKEQKSHSKVPLSCQEFTANQFRFALQSLAYIILHLLRKELPPSRTHKSILSVRKLLLLVPVRITTTPRRLLWSLSSVHPTSNSIVQLAKKLHARSA